MLKDAGNVFPDFPLQILDKPPTTAKAALAGSWSVLLLYRGHWYDPGKKFLHATGFIVKPDGVVAPAVYSTGPIGRFTHAHACSNSVHPLTASQLER